MENKNISLKFILQAQAKYKTFTMRYVFSVTNQKIYSAKVSYSQNSDIREVSIALV